jgi:hypothetical protein
MVPILIGNRLSKVRTLVRRSTADRREAAAAPRAEPQEVAPLASVVALGTPGSTSAELGRLVAEAHRRLLAEADDTPRPPGRAAGLAGFFGASSTNRLPTEVAITDSMRRFTLSAHVAAVS